MFGKLILDSIPNGFISKTAIDTSYRLYYYASFLISRTVVL